MRKIWLFVPFLFLSACIGTTQNSKFYYLQAENTTGYVNKSLKATIGVREVNIPDYLDKPQIVTLKSGGVELDISELNRWSESLASMMQRVIANDLSYNLPNAVVKPRVSAREDFKYLVQVEIGKFEGAWNKTANLEAWWTITNSLGETLVQKRVSISTPMGDSYDEYVNAQSKLLAELSAQIAQGFSKLR